MLETLVLVGAPLLLIVLAATTALVLSSDRAPEREAKIAPEAKVSPRILASPSPAELFRPRIRVDELKEELTFEELIASIEAHLGTEHEAAKTFVHSPSAETLWVN